MLVTGRRRTGCAATYLGNFIPICFRNIRPSFSLKAEIEPAGLFLDSALGRLFTQLACIGVAHTARMSVDVVTKEIFEHLPGRDRLATLEDARFGDIPLCDEITAAKVSPPIGVIIWPLRLLLPFLQHCIGKAEMGIRVFTNPFDLIDVDVSVFAVAIARRESLPLFS
jgi:hypothetical protein